MGVFQALLDREQGLDRILDAVDLEDIRTMVKDRRIHDMVWEDDQYEGLR